MATVYLILKFYFYLSEAFMIYVPKRPLLFLFYIIQSWSSTFNMYTYLMFLYTSFKSLNYCGIFFQYICKSKSFFYPVYVASPNLLLLFYVTGLYMVKAFIIGTFLCHTTNILNFNFDRVHWFKPPYFRSR